MIVKALYQTLCVIEIVSVATIERYRWSQVETVVIVTKSCIDSLDGSEEANILGCDAYLCYPLKVFSI